jgi:hypothetical protein
VWGSPPSCSSSPTGSSSRRCALPLVMSIHSFFSLITNCRSFLEYFYVISCFLIHYCTTYYILAIFTYFTYVLSLLFACHCFLYIIYCPARPPSPSNRNSPIPVLCTICILRRILHSFCVFNLRSLDLSLIL